MGKLSKRWIKEGEQFKNQLNAFLDAIYSGGEGPEEPHETRGDMAEKVYHKAIELNKKGKHQKLRELYPPAYEPFQEFYESISRSINQIIVLKNDQIIVRADGNVYLDDGNVYLLENDKVTKQKGVLAFGISANKEFVAKVNKKNIQVFSDWNGAAIAEFKYPNGYGKATENKKVADFNEDGLLVLHVAVFNDGKRVLLATSNGVFVLSNNKSECIFPTQEMMPELLKDFYEEYEEDEAFEFSADYIHADLSPDNTKIAAGFQSSQHCILEDKGNGFEETGSIQARSEYPHAVGFHDTLDHIAMASCHFQQSGIVGMDLKHLPMNANASWYEELDEKFDALSDNMWVYAILPYKEGYLLGANNGYIWYLNPKDPKDKAYLHVGGTIMSMDFSKDKTHLVVTTFSGYVIKFDLTATTKDKTLVTDMPIKETNRWVIWKDIDPLIW